QSGPRVYGSPFGTAQQGSCRPGTELTAGRKASELPLRQDRPVLRVGSGGEQGFHFCCNGIPCRRSRVCRHGSVQKLQHSPRELLCIADRAEVVFACIKHPVHRSGGGGENRNLACHCLAKLGRITVTTESGFCSHDASQIKRIEQHWHRLVREVARSHHPFFGQHVPRRLSREQELQVRSRFPCQAKGVDQHVGSPVRRPAADVADIRCVDVETERCPA